MTRPAGGRCDAFECREGPHALSVPLDHLDPYRGLHETLDPHRLDDTEVTNWQRMLDRAWYLICRISPTRQMP
ncbi:hypothetical protein SALBM311S_05981 [Streptomyces alboniger]